jgi:hypothetical protein
MTMKGYGRKRRSFGEINKMVIFRESVLKETYYKDRFMGKSSKSLLFFFKKDIEISKQSFNKQKYILLFSTRI